jgi:membrane protease YdiL (CAAX protease family)
VFGLSSFAVFAALAAIIIVAVGESLADMVPLLPWILLWAFANSVMEELWFRGIFLKRYEPLIGRVATVLVTSIVFGLSHWEAQYFFPGGGASLAFVVFVLGAAGARAMFRSDSVLGPILFHAGYDLLIILPVLESA